MNSIKNFIIIDDDAINNTLCSMTLKKVLDNVEIETFTSPENGLAFIREKFNKSMEPTILFLDINMPSLNGWEFLEEYEKISEEVKGQISIYMLSSSVNQRDKDTANDNRHIKGFISKPLLTKTIISISNT